MTTLALGCGGGGPATTAPKLEPAAFAQPWLLIDLLPSGRPIDDVTHGPAGYIALTHEPVSGKISPRNNIVARSRDGVNWAEWPIAPDGHYNSIAFGAGLYVAVGGRFSGGGPGVVIASPDGREWREVGAAAAVLRRVRHTPGGFVAVGVTGVAVVSTDGLVWRESSAAQAHQLWDVAFGRGRFVAAGDALATSTDGRTWQTVACGRRLPCTPITDPSGGQHAILALNWALFAADNFLVSGVAGLLRSADGINWERLGPARADKVIFDGGLFLELAKLTTGAPTEAPTYAVSSSRDGQLWEPRTTAAPFRSDLTCTTSRCLLFPGAIVLVPGM